MKKDFFLTKIDHKILLFVSIFIALLVIIRNILLDNYNLFFWFCDFTPFFVLLALRLKNRSLLQGIANVGFIVQSIYLVGLLMAFFGFNALGLEEILSQGRFLIFVTIAIHFFNIILFFIIVKYKPIIRGVIHSIGVLAVMYFPAILLFTSQDNINKVYFLEPFSNYLPFYNSLWIFWMFLIIVIPTHLIAKFLHSKFYSRSP